MEILRINDTDYSAIWSYTLWNLWNEWLHFWRDSLFIHIFKQALCL